MLEAGNWTEETSEESLEPVAWICGFTVSRLISSVSYLITKSCLWRSSTNIGWISVIYLVSDSQRLTHSELRTVLRTRAIASLITSLNLCAVSLSDLLSPPFSPEEFIHCRDPVDHDGNITAFQELGHGCVKASTQRADRQRFTFYKIGSNVRIVSTLPQYVPAPSSDSDKIDSCMVQRTWMD